MLFVTCFAIAATAQHKLTGTVTDELGEPLPGVTIMEKGTPNGIATDLDGKYSIILKGKNLSLPLLTSAMLLLRKQSQRVRRFLTLSLKISRRNFQKLLS